MTKRTFYGPKLAAGAMVFFAIAGLVGLAQYVRAHKIAVLEPAGTIASKERELIVVAVLLSVVVVVPVYVLTIAIVWKYRANNHRATYMPEWDRSKLYEAIWWGVPLAIITVLSVITWQSSHLLDPFRRLDGTKARPMTIQVVALQWKWLFIYPEQHVASVNLLELPVNTPVTFDVTADAPMNSFWIPRLGSQIYAMPGMSTQVHLMATQAGNYRGSSANISGTGFANMEFAAHAVSATEFNTWLRVAEHSPAHLDQMAYDSLAMPSTPDHASFYSMVDPNLYDSIVMKYNAPSMTMGTQ